MRSVHRGCKGCRRLEYRGPIKKLRGPAEEFRRKPTRSYIKNPKPNITPRRHDTAGQAEINDTIVQTHAAQVVSVLLLVRCHLHLCIRTTGFCFANSTI